MADFISTGTLGDCGCCGCATGAVLAACNCCLACNGRYYSAYTLVVTPGPHYVDDPASCMAGTAGTFTLRKVGGGCTFQSDEHYTDMDGPTERAYWTLVPSGTGGVQGWELLIGQTVDLIVDADCIDLGGTSGNIAGSSGTPNLTEFNCRDVYNGLPIGFSPAYCFSNFTITPIGDPLDCGCTACYNCWRACPQGIFSVSLGLDPLAPGSYGVGFARTVSLSPFTILTDEIDYYIDYVLAGTIQLQIECLGSPEGLKATIVGGTCTAGPDPNIIINYVKCAGVANCDVALFPENAPFIQFSLKADCGFGVGNILGEIYCRCQCCLPISGCVLKANIIRYSDAVSSVAPVPCYACGTAYNQLNDMLLLGVFGLPAGSPPPENTVSLPATSTTDFGVDIQISGPATLEIRQFDFGSIFGGMCAGSFFVGESNILYDHGIGNTITFEFAPPDGFRVCNVYFQISAADADVGPTDHTATVKVYNSNGDTDTFSGTTHTVSMNDGSCFVNLLGAFVDNSVVRAYSPVPYSITKMEVTIPGQKLAFGQIHLCVDRIPAI